MDLHIIQIMCHQIRFLFSCLCLDCGRMELICHFCDSLWGRTIVLCRAQPSASPISLVMKQHSHCKNVLIILVAFTQNQKGVYCIITICKFLGDTWVEMGTFGCLLIQASTLRLSLHLSCAPTWDYFRSNKWNQNVIHHATHDKK